MNKKKINDYAFRKKLIQPMKVKKLGLSNLTPAHKTLPQMDRGTIFDFNTTNMINNMKQDQDPKSPSYALKYILKTKKVLTYMLNTFILNRLGYIHKSGLRTKKQSSQYFESLGDRSSLIFRRQLYVSLFGAVVVDQRVNFLGLDFKHVLKGVPNVFLVCAYIHHENQRILFDDRLYCSFGNKGILENLLIIH
ncbi:hypothetical protein HanXRQr2_Chr11g0469301 [Helianthus annuus]|uniref:Uncharacterized protein n=1 Tax=Helianthus annuus TaxID=4232 RepID=A0A9K3MYD6_HELAN|nr:hypothetical protein HanXRQr2_Chr11g0469301 [Helianthus annuus]